MLFTKIKGENQISKVPKKLADKEYLTHINTQTIKRAGQIRKNR